MLAAIIRFSLGVAALIMVWLGTVEFEEGGRRLPVFALFLVGAVISIVLGSIASFLLTKSRRFYGLDFLSPFFVPAIFCSSGGIADHAFLYWTAVLSVVLIANLCVDAVVFRTFHRDEKSRPQTTRHLAEPDQVR